MVNINDTRVYTEKVINIVPNGGVYNNESFWVVYCESGHWMRILPSLIKESRNHNAEIFLNQVLNGEDMSGKIFQFEVTVELDFIVGVEFDYR